MPDISVPALVEEKRLPDSELLSDIIEFPDEHDKLAVVHPATS